MKAIALNGSPRIGGNTSTLMKVVLSELESEGVTTEIIQVGGKAIRGCIACGKCQEMKNRQCSLPDDGVNEIINKMAEADVIIIGSPVYFANIASEIKAVIDRSGYVGRANGGLYKRKIGAAVVAVRRAGAIHVYDSINHFFGIAEMIVPAASYWNIGVGRLPGEVEQDAEGIATMKNLGQNIAWVLKKIKA